MCDIIPDSSPHYKKYCILCRSPFTGQLDYQDRKSELLKLSLAIATCAQRDRFAERPVEAIRTSCKELARLADSIIQDIMDPLILQPASLDLATLKKRAGDDLVSNVSAGWHYKRGNTVFHAIYLFMVCIMTLLVVQTVLHQLAGPPVNSELEGVLQEAVMALFQVLHQHFPGETAENLDSNSFRIELVIISICDFLLYYRGFLLYHLSTVYTRLGESSSAHLPTSVGKLKKEMKLCRSTIRQW